MRNNFPAKFFLFFSTLLLFHGALNQETTSVPDFEDDDSPVPIEPFKLSLRYLANSRPVITWNFRPCDIEYFYLNITAAGSAVPRSTTDQLPIKVILKEQCENGICYHADKLELDPYSWYNVSVWSCWLGAAEECSDPVGGSFRTRATPPGQVGNFSLSPLNYVENHARRVEVKFSRPIKENGPVDFYWIYTFDGDDPVGEPHKFVPDPVKNPDPMALSETIVVQDRGIGQKARIKVAAVNLESGMALVGPPTEPIGVTVQAITPVILAAIIAVSLGILGVAGGVLGKRYFDLRNERKDTPIIVRQYPNEASIFERHENMMRRPLPPTPDRMIFDDDDDDGRSSSSSDQGQRPRDRARSQDTPRNSVLSLDGLARRRSIPVQTLPKWLGGRRISGPTLPQANPSYVPRNELRVNPPSPDPPPSEPEPQEDDSSSDRSSLRNLASSSEPSPELPRAVPSLHYTSLVEASQQALRHEIDSTSTANQIPSDPGPSSNYPSHQYPPPPSGNPSQFNFNSPSPSLTQSAAAAALLNNQNSGLPPNSPISLPNLNSFSSSSSTSSSLFHVVEIPLATFPTQNYQQFPGGQRAYMQWKDIPKQS